MPDALHILDHGDPEVPKLTINLAGLSGTYTLNETQAGYEFFILIGAKAGAVNIIVPSSAPNGRSMVFDNISTGGAVTVQTSALGLQATLLANVNEIYSDGTDIEQMSQVISPAFPATIGVGGATPAPTGAGVSFPATQSASADPNTLDDYEEGTWSPSFTGSGGGTFTATVNKAKYTKIGRITYFLIDFTVTAVGTATGLAQFTLPTTSTNDAQNVFPGREVSAVGFMFAGTNAPNSNIVAITRYDNATLFGLNYRYVIEGFYE